MSWDDTKTTGSTLTASEWNDMVTDQKTRITELSEDTTPVLGGDLDLSTFNIEGADAADLVKLSQLTATSTELNYVDGVTSAIQSQLNGKEPTKGSDDNYVTDAEKVVIGNTSGTNTGDQDLSGLALKSNVLELDNTNAFTPDADYEPATKKYVDDNAGGSGTVTSVAISGSDGIEVDSGSPITTSGTIALGVNKTTMLSTLNVEDGADVTDTTNVTAAGALMDSEVDADIKTLTLPANTTISTYGASLIDDTDAAAARSTLDVDQAGTDNSTDVTLSGTPDYITISGQVITRNQIDLTADVTGNLPDGNIASSDDWDAKMDDVVDDTTPQLGGNLDFNSKGLKITGQTVGGSNGNLVYLSSANTWSQADASAESTASNALGIRLSSTEVLLYGIYATTSLTAASIYYLSETAGAITTTKPTTSGSIVRIIGKTISTNNMYFSPDATYVENV